MVWRSAEHTVQYLQDFSVTESERAGLERQYGARERRLVGKEQSGVRGRQVGRERARRLLEQREHLEGGGRQRGRRRGERGRRGERDGREGVVGEVRLQLREQERGEQLLLLVEKAWKIYD